MRNEILIKTSGSPILLDGPEHEKEATHLVALLEEVVVGTLFIHPNQYNQQTGQIKQVAISNQYQGLGIGYKLMNYAEDVAKELGLYHLYLDGRENAWRFYEKLNYIPTGDIFSNGSLNFLRFEKEI